MCTGERKSRGLVAEGNFFPARFVVTSRTSCSKLSLVSVVSEVTLNAGLWRLGKLNVDGMTRRAGDASMRTLEWIVCEIVVEVFPVEGHKRSVSAFVLSMAPIASRRSDHRVKSMVAFAGDDLLVDVLVAIPAAPRLRLLVERNVAVLAVIT